MLMRYPLAWPLNRVRPKETFVPRQRRDRTDTDVIYWRPRERRRIGGQQRKNFAGVFLISSPAKVPNGPD